MISIPVILPFPNEPLELTKLTTTCILQIGYQIELSLFMKGPRNIKFNFLYPIGRWKNQKPTKAVPNQSYNNLHIYRRVSLLLKYGKTTQMLGLLRSNSLLLISKGKKMKPFNREKSRNRRAFLSFVRPIGKWN